MIKLNRENEPLTLSQNKTLWTKNLMGAVHAHKTYKNIPEKEKEKLVSPYRQKDIKDALIKSSNNKCAFCECIPAEGGNVEIEHFKPKSMYPNSTFEWLNFLPSCRKCNGSKSDHDTISKPIVNPYDLDPETIFYFEDIEIKAFDGINNDIGNETIEVCGLNTVRLWKPRADILVNLRIFSKSIKRSLQDIEDANTERKKNNKIKNLKEAIETIEVLINPKEKYSSFCKYFLANSDIYKEAKKLVNSL